MVKKENKKIKLYGVVNEKDFGYYTFDKSKKVHEVLGELFEKIFNTEWKVTEERCGDMDKPQIIHIDISKNKDFRQSLHSRNSGVRTDIFYGNKKMLIIIHCSQGWRMKFNKELEKVSIMPKPLTYKQKIEKKK